MESFLQNVKKSASAVALLSPAMKKSLLMEMAQALRENSAQIITENKKDLEYAEQNHLPKALIARLLLDASVIDSMAIALEEIAALKEPVGRVLDGWVVDSGIRIEKVSIPIGVIAIIYESRPNVTSDTAALCLKSGNVCVLKGGKEALHSNQIIAEILQKVLIKNNLPREIISLIPDNSREAVAQLIKMDKYVDLIIPRGGEALISFVSKNATIPVIKHDKGLCHTFIDKDANIDQAIEIVINAKCQRTSACNALETLLVHADIAELSLARLESALKAKGTKIIGCEKTAEYIPVIPATPEDYACEYLDNILTIKITQSMQETIEHINHYGSGHSEAIITENYTRGEHFLNSVDAACVYINASTRFTDGGEFGFGAEVGISTSKLHARGPMGINDLTTYKFKIYGQGQIRV